MKQLFGDVYVGRRVLVTGHTGFKGSWLCLWLQAMGADVCGLALAPNTEPAHWNLLSLDGVADHRVDLRDKASVTALVRAFRPEIVFHLAAQPLVRRSYSDPVETFDTNIVGLVNLLEAIRDMADVRAVVNATTDKVYLEQQAETGYTENDPLGGHDPYSTSKACAELISECYRKSFFTGSGAPGPRLATARAGNVIGGGDWSQDRLVPDLVRAAVTGQPLRLRNPKAIRPWQHVLEPLSGYLRLGQALIVDGAWSEGPWNFGPAKDATLTVDDLVSIMTRLWPGVEPMSSPEQHPHEAATLRLDCGKAARGLGWRPVWDAATTCEHTISWYRDFQERGVVASADQLREYVADARGLGLDWTA